MYDVITISISEKVNVQVAKLGKLTDQHFIVG